ncbi:hypothetical protein RN001_002341 [Aquatica leii]|uniref:Uncharacterized protein n=1 Tax=Aquatica leii TaxID=1421715 RepID=A0AAN7QB20_9COLE|nr:hypothetical protein RN001_002341 [Aquatica leii]
MEADTGGHRSPEDTSVDMTISVNAVRSKRGVASLANKTKRWSDKVLMRVPSPTRYTIEFPKTFKQNFVPFNQTLGKEYEITSKTPGPGMYNTEKKCCRRTNIDYNFGFPKLVPAVEIECNPLPTSRCTVPKNTVDQAVEESREEWNSRQEICQVETIVPVGPGGSEDVEDTLSPEVNKEQDDVFPVPVDSDGIDQPAEDVQRRYPKRERKSKTLGNQIYPPSLHAFRQEVPYDI